MTHNTSSLLIRRSVFMAAVLGWCSQAWATTNPIPTGAVTFEAAATAGPIIPVPTLSLLAAIMLSGGVIAVALHALRRRNHALASIFGLVAIVGLAVSVVQVGQLYAGSIAVASVTVNEADLTQPVTFDCGDEDNDGSLLVTTFTNATGLTIVVTEIDDSDVVDSRSCLIDETLTTCSDDVANPTTLAPDESCVMAAGAESLLR